MALLLECPGRGEVGSDACALLLRSASDERPCNLVLLCLPGK